MGFFGKTPEKIGANTPVNSRVFRDGDTGTDNLANNHSQHIEFYHLPSGYFVLFKAFITQYTDEYRSQWKPTAVYGRMDDIATFVKTSRTISVGVQAVAASVQEAEQNMTRISLLMQMLYPSYNTGDDPNISTIKGSPLFKIKFLNWIKGTGETSLKTEEGGGAVVGHGTARHSGLLGYLDGITFQPNLDAGVFQAGLEIYPKVVDLSFTFHVIHEHALGWKEPTKLHGLQNRVQGQPQTPRFPYGRNTIADVDKLDAKMENKQLEKNKAFATAQAKLITG